jgi:hypothetical protein
MEINGIINMSNLNRRLRKLGIKPIYPVRGRVENNININENKDMSKSFSTQDEKNKAVAAQQVVVNTASPSEVAEAKEELVELQAATVTA